MKDSGQVKTGGRRRCAKSETNHARKYQVSGKREIVHILHTLNVVCRFMYGFRVEARDLLNAAQATLGANNTTVVAF